MLSSARNSSSSLANFGRGLLLEDEGDEDDSVMAAMRNEVIEVDAARERSTAREDDAGNEGGEI